MALIGLCGGQTAFLYNLEFGPAVCFTEGRGHTEIRIPSEQKYYSKWKELTAIYLLKISWYHEWVASAVQRGSNKGRGNIPIL